MNIKNRWCGGSHCKEQDVVWRALGLAAVIPDWGGVVVPPVFIFLRTKRISDVEGVERMHGGQRTGNAVTQWVEDCEWKLGASNHNNPVRAYGIEMAMEREERSEEAARQARATGGSLGRTVSQLHASGIWNLDSPLWNVGTLVP